MLLGSALPSFAITAPTSGSLFYDVYDIVVNSMLKGAIGFVAAILVFMMGIGLFFVQKIIPGIIGVVCAALIIKADAIVTSLGSCSEELHRRGETCLISVSPLSAGGGDREEEIPPVPDAAVHDSVVRA